MLSYHRKTRDVVLSSWISNWLVLDMSFLLIISKCTWTMWFFFVCTTCMKMITYLNTIYYNSLFLLNVFHTDHTQSMITSISCLLLKVTKVIFSWIFIWDSNDMIMGSGSRNIETLILWHVCLSAEETACKIMCLYDWVYSPRFPQSLYCNWEIKLCNSSLMVNICGHQCWKTSFNIEVWPRVKFVICK